MINTHVKESHKAHGILGEVYVSLLSTWRQVGGFERLGPIYVPCSIQ
jgi:hypothetical protein